MDPLTGFTEYFVVPVNRIRGIWYSEANIDESNLVLYRFDQRKLAQQGKRPPKPPTPPPAPYKPGPTPAKAKVATATVPNSMLPSQSKAIQSYESMYNEALQKHKIDTFELLKKSAAKGEKSVSVAAIGEARKVNVAVMRRANANMMKHSGKYRKEQEITAALSRAEGEAVQLYIAEAQKKRKEAASSTST